MVSEPVYERSIYTFIIIHVALSDVSGRVAIQSNLPPGFLFCDPEIGFAHGSLKSPLHSSDLLHYTELDDCIQTMYLLGATNLFNVDSPLQLHFIYVKHHLKERWYFIDGAAVSTNGTCVTEFLLKEPNYDRGPQPMPEMNGTVQRILPKMLRKTVIAIEEIYMVSSR